MSGVDVYIHTVGRHGLDDDDRLRAETAVLQLIDGDENALVDFQEYGELVAADVAGFDLTVDEELRALELGAWFAGLEAAAHIAATAGWLDPNGLELEVVLVEAGAA